MAKIIINAQFELDEVDVSLTINTSIQTDPNRLPIKLSMNELKTIKEANPALIKRAYTMVKCTEAIVELMPDLINVTEPSTPETE
jgi:ABC-type Fe3+-hydroxamate transport system substrate-binding protein